MTMKINNVKEEGITRENCGERKLWKLSEESNPSTEEKSGEEGTVHTKFKNIF